jgi:DNA-directed RNA polymerase subunit beta
MSGKDKQIKFSRKTKFAPFFSSHNPQSSMNSISFTKLTCSMHTMQGQNSNGFSLFFSKKEKTEKSTKYILQKYQRSNQDTLIFQRPLVREGEWIQSGDILADCSTSLGGELSLGKNIFIAYMPWEGYNYEDAILISQRLVTEDVYTSIHIESYEVETKSTKLGKEQITKKIPEVPESQLCHLDERGIVKRGTSVKEGDILVGKVTPVQKKFISAYEKLLYTILEKELIPMRDSSLRTPKGLKAKVLEVKILNFSPSFPASGDKKRQSSAATLSKSESFSSSQNSLNQTFRKKTQKDQNIFQNPFFTEKNGILFKDISIRNKKENTFLKPTLGKLQTKFQNSMKSVSTVGKNFSFFVPSFSTNTKIFKRKQNLFSFFVENQEKTRNFQHSFQQTLNPFQSSSLLYLQSEEVDEGSQNSHNFSQRSSVSANQVQKSGHLLRRGLDKVLVNDLDKKPEKVQVYLVEKRKIQVGDKMSGRHGNKGIVSQILPIPDMPFLPDGTPLDMVLNPLGVPSRMNVGQIYECILGLASKYLQQYYRIQPFDEIYGPQASRSFTFSKLYEARQKTSQKWLFNPCYPGKIQIFDGRTGEPYENPVTVGISYILKLVHLVDDKIHARSTGPYSLVTQQPLKGRSKYGGQRLGEMEVWAIEAYGAAFVLLEMLTIKSDDISGRMTLWSNILLNMPIYIGTPESFKVLVCELQALCLDMGLYKLNKKGFLTQIEHLMQLP